ncbi:MAG TPA: DUF3999 family protein [Candidatus Angelobacter sp.]|nr:DUF3999 family protein [Candidatus Angelobacter sp.]
MKMQAVLMAAAVLAGPSISYFKYQRPAQVAGAGQQYLVVDESVWKNARPDLGDLRLYNGQNEVPSALATERGSLERDRRSVRVLQQGTVEGKTQFLIDMSGVVEYDHIELDLAARNFVARALVEGQDDVHGAHWTALAQQTLYDFTRENLGRNSMLRLPLTTYKYLRVTIDGPVSPAAVLGASSEFRQEQKAVWREVSNSPKQGALPQKSVPNDFNGNQRIKGTLLTFAVPENVPVERVVFEVDPEQPNFKREVEILDPQGQTIGSGEISRIHMLRAGQKIDTENRTVDFSATGHKSISVIIYNGDDAPLRLKGARLEQYERRLYFDAPQQGTLTLYYGDEKLETPVYDYAKLFQQEPNAVEAKMGAEEANAGYQGRPDERPWTERHPAVLWIAIIAAVAILGAVALRSMKSATAS